MSDGLPDQGLFCGTLNPFGPQVASLDHDFLISAPVAVHRAKISASGSIVSPVLA